MIKKSWAADQVDRHTSWTWTIPALSLLPSKVIIHSLFSSLGCLESKWDREWASPGLLVALNILGSEIPLKSWWKLWTFTSEKLLWGAHPCDSADNFNFMVFMDILKPIHGPPRGWRLITPVLELISHRVFLKSWMVIHITVIKNTVSQLFLCQNPVSLMVSFSKVPYDAVLFRFLSLKNKAKAG